MTDIDAAAEAYAEDRGKHIGGSHGRYLENAVRAAFKAGIAWRDANPSPEVRGLVEALEWYADTNEWFTTTDGAEAIQTRGKKFGSDVALAALNAFNALTRDGGER